MLTIEEQYTSLKNHKIFKIQNEAEISKKDEKLSVLRESMQKLERENNNKIFEIEKLSKLKKHLKEESKIIY
jgi:hypothetical protein